MCLNAGDRGQWLELKDMASDLCRSALFGKPRQQVETLQEVLLALVERGSWQCGWSNHSHGVTKLRARVPWRLHQVC